MRTLLKTLLELEGFQVETVLCEEETALLERIQIQHPDAILLDVNLKRANGLDYLKLIRQNSDTRSIPVIMSSGMDMRERCMSFGASDFLMKPYMPDDLIATIRKYLKTLPGTPSRTC
ncbi:MAG: response regulator [Anaerolineaceae bacterium]